MEEIVVFDEVASIIAKYKVENDKLDFDYADKEDAKQAKSLMAKLRKVKTKVGEIHKEAKAESRAFGLKLDAKKNEYNGEVDKMIKVHKDPLDAIEAEVIAESLKRQQEKADAEAKRIAEIEARERAITLAEEKINREKDEAEEKIRRGKEKIAEQVMKEQQEKIAVIEEEKRIVEEKVEKLRAEAEEKAKAKVEAEAEEERLSEIAAENTLKARLAADKNHRKKIEDEAHTGLTGYIVLVTETGQLGRVGAFKVLEAIKDNKIPHVSINY